MALRADRWKRERPWARIEYLPLKLLQFFSAVIMYLASYETENLRL